MNHTERPTPGRAVWILGVTLLVAAGLLGYRLGQWSFWYDEVVTIRLALADSPWSLLHGLAQIDATRAPLHPMILEGWVMVFGASEVSARLSSLLCGLATVGLVFAIGRVAFDTHAGLWAAWLAAWSPVLIVYSREARMYAWLVTVTCFSWRMLLGAGRWTVTRAIAYGVSLVALGYSHPLGLLMTATLGLASLTRVRERFGSWMRWSLIHLIPAVIVAFWIPRYLDHPPEFLSGPLPWRFLLGTPIGFLGGNFVTLAGLGGLIAWGMVRGKPNSRPWRALVPLHLWWIVPPLALYLYSLAFQPIFGPARYTVFSAPAFLILVGLGLSRLPAILRYPLATGLTVMAASGLWAQAYDPTIRADWRGFAADLVARAESPVLVIIAPPGPGRNVEVETARYYLPAGVVPIGLDEASIDRLEVTPTVYLAVGTRQGIPVATWPERIGSYWFRVDRTYPGLITFRAEHRPPRVGLRGRNGTRGRDVLGGRFEDREHHRGEVTLEGGSRVAEGLAGRGSDLKAPLLHFRRDGAQAERLDQAEGSLDLRVLSEIVSLVGADLVGADGRGAGSVGPPVASGSLDPERRLDRDAAEVGSDRQPRHHGPDPSAPGHGF